jgi:copper transport protein
MACAKSHFARPKIIVSSILAASLVLVLFSIPVTTSSQQAFGHAVPVSYSIEPNAVFEDPDSVPPRLVISFSERPDPKISYIRILTFGNERIDNNDLTITSANGREATVTLDASRLQDDSIYSVSWRTLSLDDGHITEGAYVFGVGDIGDIAAAGGQVGEETRYVTSTLDAMLKWPVMVAQTAIVGGALAHLLLWRPFSRNSSDNNDRVSWNVASLKRLVIIIVASAVAIAGFGTALLFVQASNLATSDNSDYFSIFQSLISGSPSGSVWILRIATSAAIIAVSIGCYIVARRKTRHLRSAPFLAAILAAGAASVFSNSMLSHNSASPFLPEVAIFSDWLHFMAVSVWVGGLFYFSAVAMEMIRGSNKDAIQTHKHLSLVLPKFSILAIISLGIIGITGIYMAWIHIHDFNFLFETAYGNSLIVKLSAAVPMIALGGYHQLILHKSMVMLASGRQQVTVENNDDVRKSGRNEHDAASRFGKTVKIESFIGIGVLLAASFLTITSPPSQQHHQAVGSDIGLETVTIDNTEVTIGISPFQVGVNTFTVTLRNEEGQDPTNIQNVFMRFTNTEAGIGSIIATLEKVDGSFYSVTGAFLSQPGTWKIDFIAQRTGAYDLNHSFEETLTAALTSNGETHSDHEQPSGDDIPANSMNTQVTAIPPSETFTLTAIILSIGIAGASTYSVIRSRQQLGRTIKSLIR